MKIAINTSSFAKFDATPLNILQATQAQINQNSLGRVLTEAETSNLIAGCIGIIAGTEPLTAKVMDANPKLKVISRCGVGLNSVDMSAAKARGITVCTTPHAPSLAVAELTLALALSLLRNIPQGHADIKNGIWQKRGGSLLHNKKIGIIGLGRIGKKVAEIFSNLNCHIAYYDPHLKSAQNNYQGMQLNTLLAWADIVTLHCPQTPKPILSTKEFQIMQSHALLINTARGGLINEADLYNCLQNSQLGGAALDVFEVEPYTGPLAQLENTILSPHCASFAREARIQMELEAVNNLLTSLGISCQSPA